MRIIHQHRTSPKDKKITRIDGLINLIRAEKIIVVAAIDSDIGSAISRLRTCLETQRRKASSKARLAIADKKGPLLANIQSDVSLFTVHLPHA